MSPESRRMAGILLIVLPEPNGLINLAYVGAVLVAGGTLTLGIGLVRSHRE
jgi:hypothetical protein